MTSLRLIPRRGVLAALVVTAGLTLAPAVANADTASTLTVVGTSDVSDSGLVPNLIQPEFTAAYPQFTFKYVGTATGTAIMDAENGTQGPSVLIVHAASLEDSFVSGGYSYEPYGRAIFTNDFVLAGPKGDPAGVAANAPHNAVQAFADIATAGIAGTAEFLSRSGSPGTTVEEHEIWQDVGEMASPPVGLLLCTLTSSTSGGGESPIAAGNGVTVSGQDCPGGGGTPPQNELPDWYQSANLTQGPNVVAANACTGFNSGANSCYVLTDRGTFDYLSSGTDPAGSIPNLTILTRNNSASAPGGANLLTNYFHVYIINPAKFSGQTGIFINIPAAEDFANFLTSPTLQSQLVNYLPTSVTGDPGGPPFVADASPSITASGIPSAVAAGTPVTVTGNIANAEPGYPALAGQPVTIDELVGGLPVPVGTANTNTGGNYSITFTPTSSGAYQASTGQIAQIENATLNPVFGDLLSPAATTPVNLTVQFPSTPTPGPLPSPVIPPPPAAPLKLPSSSVSLKTLTVTNGALTATGVFSPAPTASGARIELFADREQKLVTPKAKAKQPKKTAKAASTGFKVIATTSIATDKTTYTIKAKVTRGYRWAFQVEYVDPDRTASFSRAVGVNVH